MSNTKTRQSYDEAAEVEADIEAELDSDKKFDRDVKNPKRAIARIESIDGIEEKNYGMSNNIVLIKLTAILDTLETKDVFIQKNELDKLVDKKDRNNIADLVGEKIHVNKKSDGYWYTKQGSSLLIEDWVFILLSAIIISTIIALPWLLTIGLSFVSQTLGQFSFVLWCIIAIYILFIIFKNNNHLDKWEEIENNTPPNF